MRVRDRLGIDAHRQAQLSRAMQATLGVLIGVGVARRNPGIVVNAAVALAVTYLPGVLERDYSIPMDAGLTLWLTTAVFLHALGTVGVPGLSDESLYRDLWWWDHLTHAFSASVVAAVGYTTTRAIDRHTDAVHFPSRFTFVFVLMFTIAFGVLWEVLEFTVTLLAGQFGADSVLTQYGLRDTMLDLVFDIVGAVIVAAWGTAHLTDVAGALADHLDGRRNEN